MQVLVLIDQGFEEIEALSVVDLLRRADINVDLVSANNQTVVSGSHNIEVVVDKKLKAISDVLVYDAIVIPGGLPNAKLLKDNDIVIEFIKVMHENNKLIGSICAGPISLEKAAVVENKDVTVYPGFEDTFKSANVLADGVVVSDNIVTAKGVNYALDFALELIEKLVNKAKRDEVSVAILRKKEEKNE